MMASRTEAPHGTQADPPESDDASGAATPEARSTETRPRLRRTLPRREVCTKAERTRFLRELRAGQLKAKQERRAERELAFAERVKRGNERRGYVEPPPREPGKPYIVGWMNGLPLMYTPR